MNLKQAKALRAALLPCPRQVAGTSRGRYMRGTTGYDIESMGRKYVRLENGEEIAIELQRLVHKTDTARGIYRKLKKGFQRYER